MVVISVWRNRNFSTQNSPIQEQILITNDLAVARDIVTGDYDDPNLSRGFGGWGDQGRGRVLVDEDRLRLYKKFNFNNMKDV